MTPNNQPNASKKRREEVAAMFDNIAPTYDRLNRILSVGTDQLWRRRMIRLGRVRPGDRWLDLAAGSGDVAAMGLKLVPYSQWVAADPSINLLKILTKRSDLANVPAFKSAGEQLPFADVEFDGVTVAFGIRNFENPAKGLEEMFRVLRPGGRVVLLEFLAQEKGGWGGAPLVRFYLERVLPWIGGLVSGHKSAYSYLSASSQSFWTPTQMKAELDKAGFGEVESHSWMGGAVTLTIAVKPGRP